MQSSICLNTIIECLRKHETYVYQIAFYILQNEDLAIDAAKAALLELSKNDDFYRKPHADQRGMIHILIIRKSIALHCAS